MDVPGIGTLVFVEQAPDGAGGISVNALRVQVTDPTAAQIDRPAVRDRAPRALGHRRHGPPRDHDGPGHRHGPVRHHGARDGSGDHARAPAATITAPATDARAAGASPADRAAGQHRRSGALRLPGRAATSTSRTTTARRGPAPAGTTATTSSPTAGTPVVAVADGRLSRVGVNTLGGNRLWLTDDAGNAFYYAHLSAYAPAALEGARVSRGPGDRVRRQHGAGHHHASAPALRGAPRRRGERQRRPLPVPHRLAARHRHPQGLRPGGHVDLTRPRRAARCWWTARPRATSPRRPTGATDWRRRRPRWPACARGAGPRGRFRRRWRPRSRRRGAAGPPAPSRGRPGRGGDAPARAPPRPPRGAAGSPTGRWSARPTSAGHSAAASASTAAGVQAGGGTERPDADSERPPARRRPRASGPGPRPSSARRRRRQGQVRRGGALPEPARERPHRVGAAGRGRRPPGPRGAARAASQPTRGASPTRSTRDAVGHAGHPGRGERDHEAVQVEVQRAAPAAQHPEGPGPGRAAARPRRRSREPARLAAARSPGPACARSWSRPLRRAAPRGSGSRRRAA